MAGNLDSGGRVRRRRRRRKTATLRIHKPKWIDPFPGIPGTEVEKRIFAELVRRRIFFHFQDDIPAEEFKQAGIIQPVGYHPDFIIPEYKVILDPFSDFHHTLDEAKARDRVKKVIYDAAGYASYFWWHTEVLKNGAAQMLAKVAEFDKPPVRELTDPKDVAAKRSPGYILGPHLGLGASSVAAANRARARRRRPLKGKTSVQSRRTRRRRNG